MKHFLTAALLVLSLFTAMARADWHGCHPGDSVWTDSGQEAQVQAVFPDGTLSVKIGYGNFTMRSDQLAYRGCWRGLCSGEAVLTDAGQQATINGVFQNGDFSVKIGYGNFRLRFEQLASTRPPYNPYPPYGSVQVGQLVWTDAGQEGKVAGIFPSGEISVTIGYGNFRMNRSQLAIQGCIGNLCTGYDVISRNGQKGTVNGVFPDNRSLSVKIGYGNFKMDYNDLARTWQ